MFSLPTLNPVAAAARFGGAKRNPFLSLFGSGAYKGVYFDPSDLTTIYTDRAGTILATMPGLGSAVTIGKWLDKSGGGNHMSVTADSKRPTLSARVNTLTQTEAYDNAAWSKLNAGTGTAPVLTYGHTAPDGTATAWRLQADRGASNTSGDYSIVQQAFSFSGTVPFTSKLWIKSNTGSTQNVYFRINNAAAFDATTTWQLATVSESPTSTAYSSIGTRGGASTTAAIDILIWHPDLRRSCDAIAGIPAYQRMVDALTYDTTGFPLFALFDGTDDAGTTPSIDFTGTDKMTVFAGVNEFAASVMVCELSADINTNNGAFYFYSLNTTTENLASKGTVAKIVTNTRSLVTNRVVTMTGDISAPSVQARQNGAVSTTDTASQGTGNYGNYVLNIGSRNNASLFFNGRLYHLVVVGRACSAGELTAGESAINAKMGRVY